MIDYQLIARELPFHDLEARIYRARWVNSARSNQLIRSDNYITMIKAGRSWGKTRTAAEWLWWKAYKNPGIRCGIIAPNHGDLMTINFEGKSGITKVIPPSLLAACRYVKSPYPLIEFPNGSIISGFSAEDPNRLRGPETHMLWCDEICSWKRLQEAFDMAIFGLRLGDKPKMLITSTPRPHQWLRTLVNRPDVEFIVGDTYENQANLSPEYIREIKNKYEGTRLGRQEIHAEVLEDNENSIFKREWFDMWPADKELPDFEYVVQSYDTAFTEKTSGDKTAFTAWGIFYHHEMKCHCALLLDAWGEHLSFPDLREKSIEEYDAQYGSNHRDVDVVLIEDKGSGISLRQELKLAGIPVIPYNPGKADKQQRAHSISHIVHGGRVFIPESSKREGQFCSWADDFIEEVANFPMEDMPDDYVDSFSQAILLLSRQTWLQDVNREDDITYSEPVVNPYTQ